MNQKIVQAVCEGELAFHSGVPLQMNPYDVQDGGTIERKLLHLAWSMAWLMEEAADIKERVQQRRADSSATDSTRH